MEKRANSKIEEAVGRFSEGEFTPEAVGQVHRWLLLRKDFEEKKEAWKAVWDRTLSTDEEVDASLAGTYRRIAAEAQRRQRIESRRRRMLYRAAAAAAAVVLIVTSSLMTLRLSDARIRRSAALTSVTAVDSARVVCLPDSSIVRLKRGTTLLYPARFDRRCRDVQLIGEAWFDVKKSAGTPFRVHAHGTQVVVRGTTFNVRAYPDRDLIETVLASGAVDFVASGRVVPLKPSQKLIYNTRDDGMEVKHVDLAEELKPDIHVFRGGSLSDAAAVIARIFGCPIRLGDAALGRIEITGTLTINGDNSLRHALDILTLTTNTRYRYDDSEVVIFQ